MNRMRDILSLLMIPAVGLSALVLVAASPAPAPGQAVAPGEVYYPEKDNWEHRKPSDVGMDETLLDQAVQWAKAHETNRPKDLSDQVRVFGKVLGPMPAERGDVNGIIIRRGYVVAEFGDTTRVDPTYSVAKSYLSTLLGLAIDRGLIKNVSEPVRDYIKDGGYDSAHNAKITWEQHARQTSEWKGTMFGKPHTFLGVEEFGAGAMKPREMREPGSYYEYNDVRINRFSLSLLRVWKRPLPEVLKAEIMDLIGASDTWKYHGYVNSDVEMGGKMVKSVPGGTRWGGGLWMSTRDHARFGYLMLRRGKWQDRQLISDSWIKVATTAGGPGDRDYGYLWWLNTKGRGWADASKTSFAAVGAGSNIIWIDPEHDLVVVWRWYRGGSESEFFRRIVAAIRSNAMP
jgi:CubicO group peptidase (beta-lactamase class C family)